MKHTRSNIPLMGSLVLLTVTMLFTPLLQAAENHSVELSKEERMKHETTGVLGGALIGGILGGPAGAIVTAAVGGWISDLTIAKKENGQLSNALSQHQQVLIALQAQYRALEARFQVATREDQNSRVRDASFIAQEQATTRNAVLSDCCNDTELVLHFKTNSTFIEPLYFEKLSEFVSFTNSIPKAVVEITGHADRRGESSKNLALSQQRVQSVENKLQSLGLHNKSLQTSAFGENKPASNMDSFEDNFFDRRVVLKLISADNSLLTRNNN